MKNSYSSMDCWGYAGDGSRPKVPGTALGRFALGLLAFLIAGSGFLRLKADLTRDNKSNQLVGTGYGYSGAVGNGKSSSHAKMQGATIGIAQTGTKIVNVNNSGCYGYSGAVGDGKSGSHAKTQGATIGKSCMALLVALILPVLGAASLLLNACPVDEQNSETEQNVENPLPGFPKFDPVEDVTPMRLVKDVTTQEEVTAEIGRVFNALMKQSKQITEMYTALQNATTDSEAKTMAYKVLERQKTIQRVYPEIRGNSIEGEVMMAGTSIEFESQELFADIAKLPSIEGGTTSSPEQTFCSRAGILRAACTINQAQHDTRFIYDKEQQFIKFIQTFKEMTGGKEDIKSVEQALAELPASVANAMPKSVPMVLRQALVRQRMDTAELLAWVRDLAKLKYDMTIPGLERSATQTANTGLLSQFKLVDTQTASSIAK